MLLASRHSSNAPNRCWHRHASARRIELSLYRSKRDDSTNRIAPFRLQPLVYQFEICCLRSVTGPQ